jgi:TolB protein
LLSAIDEGNSDIYELNIAANSAQRLTKSPAIDTTPTYSPDVKYITFASDRDGSQQLYVMDVSGSSVKKISLGEGSYSKPVWSPDGKLIAFTKSKGGKFYIGVMTPSGSGERLLTSGYLVEGARWSPSGRYLIFSRKNSPYGQSSVPRIYIVDVLTGFEVELPIPAGEGATDPDWV